MSADGLTIYVAGIDGVVRAYATETGELIASWTVGNRLGAIDISPDGTYLIATEINTGPTTPPGNPNWGSQTTVYAYKLNLTSGAVTTYPFQAQNFDQNFYDVAILSDGRAYFSQSYFGSGSTKIQVLDVASGQYATALTDSFPAGATLTVSEDRHSMLISNGNTSSGSDSRYSLDTNSFSSAGSYNPGWGGSGGLVAYTQSHGGIVVQSYGGQLMASGTNLTQLNSIFYNNAGFGFDATGDYLYVIIAGYSPTKSLVKVSTSDWQVVQTISLPLSYNFFNSALASEVIVGPGSRFFLLYEAGNLVRVDNPLVTDAIAGTQSADTIGGTAGADTLIGYGGNDTYTVNHANDIVIESASGGTDRVEASVSWVMGAGQSIETLSTTDAAGTSAIDLTGNALGNTLIGNAGNNILTGGGGLDTFYGGAGDDTMIGGDAQDFFSIGSGTDTVIGAGGIDLIYAGADLTSADSINGGASNDFLGLQGDYSNYTFGANNLVGIEALLLLTGSITTYSGGSVTDRHDYHLTTIDANVAAGQMLLVNGSSLLPDETLYFNGAAETNGSFFFFGGQGADTLRGGSGADIFASGTGQDTLTGGGGNDIFYYRFESESPTSARDHITDFTAGDRLNIAAFGPSGVGSTAISFIGSAGFSNVVNQLRVSGSGTSWVVELDRDGDGDADFAVTVTTTVSGYGWSASDFVM